MLSCTTHSLIKCDDGSHCRRPKLGEFAPPNFQSVYVPYCVLHPSLGALQSVSTIITTHAASRVDCHKCPARLTKQELFLRAPMVLALFTCAQQVSACHSLSCRFLLPLVAVCKLLCQVYRSGSMYQCDMYVLNQKGHI